MRKRVNFQLLKLCQQQTQKQSTTNPLQQELYKASYELINDLLCDIKRPFKNICIHGYKSEMMIDYLKQHRDVNLKATQNQTKQHHQQGINGPLKSQQSTITNKIASQQQKPKLTIIDYLDILQTPQVNQLSQHFQLSVQKVQNSDSFLAEQQQFDLIISALELNHCNNQEKMLQKYLRTLKPDGALIGCAMVEGTLSQLHWSYLMAENQRHGGLSPKVLNFPSLGQLGNLLTQSHYHLATVLNRDYHLQLQSPLQVIKMVQQLGQSMWLRGRRKGVYKQLLVAMYAMYQSEFEFNGMVKNMEGTSMVGNDQTKDRQPQSMSLNNENSVLATLVLSPFVGWKYSPNQPKPLRRGQLGESVDFIDELRKYDPDLEHFIITEDSDQPQQVKSKQAKNNQQQSKCSTKTQNTNKKK